MIVLILINLYTFILYGYDKFCAVHNKWRIPELMLLLATFLGGALCAFLGMYIFRHKTKHKLFTCIVPLCLLIQFLIIIFIL